MEKVKPFLSRILQVALMALVALIIVKWDGLYDIPQHTTNNSYHNNVKNYNDSIYNIEVINNGLKQNTDSLFEYKEFLKLALANARSSSDTIYVYDIRDTIISVLEKSDSLKDVILANKDDIIRLERGKFNLADSTLTVISLKLEKAEKRKGVWKKVALGTTAIAGTLLTLQLLK